LWRTHFGRGYGPFVRQTREWMNIKSTIASLLSCFNSAHTHICKISLNIIFPSATLSPNTFFPAVFRHIFL
jgi:hypothetical protein